MDIFFSSREPYDIALRITNGHALTNDLVHHVMLIIHDKKDIENIGGLFARTCWNQWTWNDSEFNRSFLTDFIELNEGITPSDTTKPIRTPESIALDEYLNEIPRLEHQDPAEWFRRQVVKFTLCGMTYREIQESYGINKDYTVQILKQFKNDFRDYFNKHRDSPSQSDVSPSEL